MKKIFLTSILSVFIIIFMVSTEAKAYNTFNKHKLVYGVGNYGKSTQHYWIDSSASEFTSYIDNAMNDWKYTTRDLGITTPIWYTRTTVKTSSRIDIEQVSSVNTWWGLTLMYSGSTLVYPKDGECTSDWVWAKILLDGDFVNLQNDRKKPVIAHEMGHAMGLAHTSFTDALMRPDVAFCTQLITRARPNDLAGINYLY